MPAWLGYLLGMLLWAVALMTGILSILRETLSIFFPTQVPQRSIFWNCVMIAFVFSAGILWYLEREKTSDLAKQLSMEREHSKPQLHAEINRTLTAPAANESQGTFMVVFLTITNTGIPSIVNHIRLAIEIEQQKIMGQPFPLPLDGFGLEGPDGRFILKTEDDLPKKCISNPIATGGAAAGYFAVFIPNIQRDRINKVGTFLTITFQDVTGRLYEVKHYFTGNREGMLDASKILTKQ